MHKPEFHAHIVARACHPNDRVGLTFRLHLDPTNEVEQQGSGDVVDGASPCRGGRKSLLQYFIYFHGPLKNKLQQLYVFLHGTQIRRLKI